jgi:hypothetical protein
LASSAARSQAISPTAWTDPAWAQLFRQAFNVSVAIYL